MKKPLFLTVVLALMLQVTSFGQSIKLNNQNDAGSAMLEVNSASKGILIPNVSLTGSADATTIASPAVSLLVYNTATVSDVEPGYYYNSGTAVLPVWSRLSTGTNSQIGTNTTNYLSKWNGTALASSSVFDDGTNVGIGTSSPSFPIDVQGTGGESIRAYTTDAYYAGYLSKNSTREFFAGVQADFETNDAISGYHIYDNTAGVRRFVIDKDGDVGIGESNPNAKLHVNGNVKVAGIISGVSDPVNSQDAATKAYADLLELRFKAYVDSLKAEVEALKGVKDIDNNRYDIITIGTQTWMAENLKTTRYNDGSLIPLITDGAAWLNASTNTSPGYCWYNAPNESSNLISYGALYNWYAINTTTNGNKNVCPTGWHVPTDDEWTTLTTYLGGETVAGGKMKEAGLAHWVTPNTGATNESGFAGLPGGYRSSLGAFDLIGGNGLWWSSSENFSTYAWGRYLNSASGGVGRSYYYKGSGFSVRCLRD
jgi:uncharacterized protein (TIGR02145 family)